MSGTYLVQTIAAKSNTSGGATAVARPDVGQFWAVDLVRVSTGKTPQNTAFQVSSHCTIYHGAVSTLNSSTYVDDTYQGSSDASSIIAGTVILYGQAVTAVWDVVDSDDIALMTIYGRSFTTLQELQDALPLVPGTRFAGGTGNAMVWEYNNFELSGPGNITAAPPVLTLPGDALAEIIYAEVTTTNSATVANRIVALDGFSTIDGNNSTVFRVANGSLRTANLTTTYTWGQGVSVVNGGIFSTSLPLRNILLPGSTVTIENINGAAGDTWSNFQVTYRQYQTLTKVSFT
jgi:hypothetical protein